MILIVGSSNDDILYFESILKNKKEFSVLNQFTAYSGEIFNQKVMLLKDMYSSYVGNGTRLQTRLGLTLFRVDNNRKKTDNEENK